MSSETPEHSLGSLCLLVADCPHATPKWTDAGAVVLRNQNIKGGRLDLSSPSFTDEEHYRSRTRRAVPQRGDIVITREAPMGDVCRIPEGLRCCLGQRQVLLRPDPQKVDARFLLFALQSPYLQHQIGWNEGTGSTVSNLRIPVLEALKVPTPHLSIQVEVATTLGAIDDRIALLHETNATLEAIAQALFKSWFVDFDPIRAKQQGIAPAGMDEATAALFPDSFDASILGPAPRGWLVRRLDELSERVGMGPFGSNIKVSSFVGDGVPVLNGSNIQGALLEDGAFRFVTKEHAARLRNSCVCTGDIVLTHRGTLGQVALIPRDLEFAQYVLSQSQFFLRCDSSVMQADWMLYFLRSPLGQHLLLANASQVGVPSIARPTTNLRAMTLVTPTVDVVNLFASIARSLHDAMVGNRGRASTLAKLRNTLLPRLISGQLRLPEAANEITESTT